MEWQKAVGWSGCDADGIGKDVTGPDDATKAIVVIYDIFGYFEQTLQGADILAHSGEQKYKVYIPDFFKGDPCPIEWYEKCTLVLARSAKLTVAGTLPTTSRSKRTSAPFSKRTLPPAPRPLSRATSRLSRPRPRPSRAPASSA